MSADLKTSSSSNLKLRSGVDFALLRQLGDATTAVFLLRGYEKFGLSERIGYHFDLTEALEVPKVEKKTTSATSEEASKKSTNAPAMTPNHQSFYSSPSSHITCGVSSLLECTPAAPWHRLSKRQKRAIKLQLRAFNTAAENTRFKNTNGILCHQPNKLPLRLNPSTRVFFAYEVTRIAFCVDASPSLTSTYGVNGSGNISVSASFGGPCCPLDQLPDMARTFFTSLVEPVSAPSLSGAGIWKPILAVTVLAVFPLGDKAETSLLVRDYRVDDEDSAKVLAENIQTWIHSDVEVGIAERMSRKHSCSSWSMPLYTSSLSDLLKAGDYALSVLSSDARPVIVIATDGRAMSCDGIVDVFLGDNRVDIPIVVLDLSLPETRGSVYHDQVSTSLKSNSKAESNFLTYDPGGPTDFPIHLSDDSEALNEICCATGGYYLDFQILIERAGSVAGNEAPPETPNPYYFSSKRRFSKMNGIQWLTLFSLSSLSPVVQTSVVKLLSPAHVRRRLSIISSETLSAKNADPLNSTRHDPLDFSRHDSFISLQQLESRRRENVPSSNTAKGPPAASHIRITFSTYFVSPIQIKTLLLMRIKEGYRARQYGTSTNDADKVFIQFILSLQMGTSIHYELSFKSLPGKNHEVGSAHIKIELSGESGFVQSVKKSFLAQTASDGRPLSYSMSQKISSRLCHLLRSTRSEDILQSYLSPPATWNDQLSSPETPLALRLGEMTHFQRSRHFRSDAFDVICTGQMPYIMEDDAFFSEFVSTDDGKHELFDVISRWSTQRINRQKHRYIKTKSYANGTTSFCLIEIEQSQIATRLFTITLEFFEGTDPGERLEIISDLKEEIESCKDVDVLGKQMGPFLLGTSNVDGTHIDFQYHHAHWDLLNDPELLPLVMKRRIEIGLFRLMRSDDNSAIFAKVVPENVIDAPGDLVQYQIAIDTDKVVVELHMESECGIFFPFSTNRNGSKRFNGMVNVLRRRDQECGRALRSRTNLLKTFEGVAEKLNYEIDEPHTDSVKRMLQYSSKVMKKIRVFQSSAGEATNIFLDMIEKLLLSRLLGVKAAKLDVNHMIDDDKGTWFIVRFDRDTMSIAHLSNISTLHECTDEKSNGKKCAYRNLSFFTSGLSDLYSKRDDSIDEDSDDTHISEYMCLTDFADRLEHAEQCLVASAAYVALRSELATVNCFDESDMRMIKKSIAFVEATNIVLAGSSQREGAETVPQGNSKLMRLLQTILTPVPGDTELLFYSGAEMLEETFSLSDDESEASLELDNVVLGDSSADSLLMDIISTHSSSRGSDSGKSRAFIATPPIFIRFKLDGKVVPFTALKVIDKSCQLSAEVSIPRDEIVSSLPKPADARKLPLSHQAVASELGILLKWFVAEETIEHLRRLGTRLSLDDLKLAQKCMKRVQSTFSFSIDVYFFVSKTDTMVLASAPAGGESEVSKGFALLNHEMQKSEEFHFNTVSAGCYYILELGQDTSLSFWCFVYIQGRAGFLSSQIYHPEGDQAAMQATTSIHQAIRGCLHRTNQQLLLQSLHQNRTASSLLIPSSRSLTTVAQEGDTAQNDSIMDIFQPGCFACPVVFRTVFELFHRCATNPGQVSRNLKATVLHSFAVSNRSGFFVYKDEAGGIFYMSLEPIGTGNDGDGKVELLVHGVVQPGPSITEQLKVLLQRRLLIIAVEMLSSVLTKNPHYRVSNADLDFLRSFDYEWKILSNDNKEIGARDEYYEFPDFVYDPTMVLLMFRQNLCGSTFFHRLNDIGYDRLSPSVTLSRDSENGGSVLRWNRHDFTLYYNNTSTKLDGEFQGISTLTEKGAELSRQTGNGIAMIEISLINASGEEVDEVAFADRVPNTFVDIAEVDTSFCSFKKLDAFPSIDSNEICVRIRITDTMLSRTHLHEWIELTLNQALAAWIIERGIEKASNGGAITDSRSLKDVKNRQRTDVEQLCPGLTSLQKMLDNSISLPHPAVSQLTHHGTIRSSTVATKTLSLLDKCIFGHVFKEFNGEALKRLHANLKIIRTSRSSFPEIVHLCWDTNKQRAITYGLNHDSTFERRIIDSPIDCPEYICIFKLDQFGGNFRKIESTLLMYKEVMIYDGVSDRSSTIQLLETLKARNPSSFWRSFAFTLSVKRNRRILKTYNWVPSMVQSASTRLMELESSFLEEVSIASHSLQRSALHLLAPRMQAKIKLKHTTPMKALDHDSASIIQTNPVEKERKESEAPIESAPTRRIRRPVMIRRPKLIGKSVEGGVMQAVAASRKRASSNQFKKVGSSTPGRRSGGNEALKPDKKIAGKQYIESTANRGGRPPSGTHRQHHEQVDLDDDTRKIKIDVRSASTHASLRFHRSSTLQRAVTFAMTDIWWPKSKGQIIPNSIATYIASKLPSTWSDAWRFPILPDKISDSFLPIFAQWISNTAPNLGCFSTVRSARPNEREQFIILTSGVKNVRGRKCLVIIKISKTSNSSSPLIRSQGWIIMLPRRSRIAQLKKQFSNLNAVLLMEKDSTAMDKLSLEVHNSLMLESVLFDFSAFLVERSIRLADQSFAHEESVESLQRIMERYALEEQKRMPMLNFRIFGAGLTLNSFRNNLIDKFTSNELLGELKVQAESRDLLLCGEGICFKQGIRVHGTRSLCFLTPNPFESTKMGLIVLCSTNGQSLSDYVFCKGHNVGMHIIDRIVFEAADLVHSELSHIAASLYKDLMWSSLSRRTSRPRKTLEYIDEMTQMCSVQSIEDTLNAHQVDNGVTILNTLINGDAGIDWKLCCQCMKKERAFGPSWSFSGKQSDTHLFYIESCHTFLLLVLDSKGTLERSDIIEKAMTPSNYARQSTVTIFANFLLHFLWRGL